jgi:outer membrane cobalamin receptor
MSNRQRYLLPFLMLLLLFCGTGLCAAVDTSVTVIDTLVVRAARTGAMPLRSDPSTTTILNLEDLSPGVDLADVLAGVAGLQVRRYGGLGAPSLPSLRGGGAAGIVVMIDGVPVADAQTGTVDLSENKKKLYMEMQMDELKASLGDQKEDNEEKSTPKKKY